MLQIQNIEIIMLKYYYIIISICNKKIVTKNIENNNNKKITKFFVQAGGDGQCGHAWRSRGGAQGGGGVDVTP